MKKWQLFDLFDLRAQFSGSCLSTINNPMARVKFAANQKPVPSLFDQSEAVIISHGRVGTEWLQFPESVNHQHQEYLERIMGDKGDTLGLIRGVNSAVRSHDLVIF